MLLRREMLRAALAGGLAAAFVWQPGPRVVPQARCFGPSMLLRMSSEAAPEAAPEAAASLEVVDTEEAPPEAAVVESSSSESFAPEVMDDEAESKPRTRIRNSEEGVPLSEIDPSSTYEGTVVAVQSYGAFVDIGATTDGLVHISQLADGYVDDVHSVVKVGQKLDSVRVLKVDVGANKLSLSLKKKQQQQSQQPQFQQTFVPPKKAGPEALEKYVDYDKEAYVPGKVVSVKSFGAFVNVEPGLDGLVHISRISDDRVEVEDLNDYVQVGQDVQVRVIDVDLQKNTLALAMDSYRPPASSAYKSSSAFGGADGGGDFQQTDGGGASSSFRERRPVGGGGGGGGESRSVVDRAARQRAAGGGPQSQRRFDDDDDLDDDDFTGGSSWASLSDDYDGEDDKVEYRDDDDDDFEDLPVVPRGLREKVVWGETDEDDDDDDDDEEDDGGYEILELDPETDQDLMYDDDEDELWEEDDDDDVEYVDDLDDDDDDFLEATLDDDDGFDPDDDTDLSWLTEEDRVQMQKDAEEAAKPVDYDAELAALLAEREAEVDEEWEEPDAEAMEDIWSVPESQKFDWKTTLEQIQAQDNQDPDIQGGLRIDPDGRVTLL